MSSISGETAQRLERFFDEARLIADITAGLPAEAISLDKPDLALQYLTGTLQRHETAYSAYSAVRNGAFIQVINVGSQSPEVRSTLGFPEDVRFARRVISRGVFGAYQQWSYVSQDGSVRQGKTDTNVTYDPRVRPWYATALAANFTVNTEPYVFQSLQRPGITFSRAMSFFDGAVFGLDISVAQLSEFLQTQRFGETTRLAITDNSGVLIAQDRVHDYLDILDAAFRKQRMPKIADLKDPILKAGLTLDRVKDDDKTVIFDSDEGDQILSWREVSGPATTNWVISVVAPVDQFTGPMVESMYRSMLFAAALILFVAIPCVTVLAGWITRPMIRVAEDADKIRKFDFSGYKPRRTIFREIEQLSKSMADMRQTIDAFSRYVPKDVVMKLMQSGQIARIGGSRQRVTLMFTDIAGFTDLSEGADPEFLLEHTSVYFEALTKAIFLHNGTIDKFIGDAIMAVWNAPLEDPLHIVNACRGILATRQASEDLNRLYE
ncbi:MAG: adenylate/guanylate cyclase domain-containing protein, partial [Rhodospirillales bacterium]